MDEGKFELFAPFQKIDERTGEFTAWATLEEIDASGEIIDIDKSWPYFQALSDQFSKNTGGVNFGPLREQHDPQKASGHLIAPPMLKTREDGVRGILINGLPTDPITKSKMIGKTLTGISIGGSYVGAKEDVTVNGRPAKKFVANPNHYAPVDSPCVKGALVTMVKADGHEVVEPLRKELAQFWDCGNDATHRHLKKTEAEACDVAKAGFTASASATDGAQNYDLANKDLAIKADATLCACCKDGDCGCASLDSGACSCHADCSNCGDEDCSGLAGKTVDGGDLVKISADARNALPDSAFALPDRRYPIDTKARAKNALARVAQFGTAAEQKKVSAAVKAKYPDLGAGDTGGDAAKALGARTNGYFKADGEFVKFKDGFDFSKSLWDVATLAEVIGALRNVASNEQYEEAWEALEAMREGETPADSSFLAQLKGVISEVYDIMEAIIADERSENDDDVYGVIALSAVARGLSKSATAKQAILHLNKSLRVQAGDGGNGGKPIKKEAEMTTTSTPAATTTEATATTPETVVKTLVCNDPEGLGGDHVHSGGVCKAEHVTPENAPIMKALGGITSKLDSFSEVITKRAEKDKENDDAIATLTKSVAFLMNQPAAPHEGALRETAAVTKADDAAPETAAAAQAAPVVRKSNKPDTDDPNGVEKSIANLRGIIAKGPTPIQSPATGSLSVTP
jgi:hypothetical protein